MGAPDKIKTLVESFHSNLDAYKTNKKNETELRRQYLDPFFTELGWDVANDKTYADAYKDVVHEFSIRTKTGVEFPDYCFRIGQTPKFFVEAKQPSVNVKDDPRYALQVRGYGWSAKHPLSILTDFEEFAVYDCRIPPNKNDKASVARVMLFTYDQYIDRWDEIASVFSREAILKGSFDKYVESNKKKKGTAEVDEVFLKQMEEWRKSLAKNIALRNPQLNIRELNYAVQKTIDRIIFLRICEDRGIEEYGQLHSLQTGTNIYQSLKQIFHRADEKYNSGLFHFEKEKDRTEPPDNFTLDLSIDDKILKEIVKELYYPESQFKFSVIPADILGQVYEQFLGKVIRLTPGHQAVIDDKPEVKKAGGVYYTPTYIVDYIVNNTIGRMLSSPLPFPKSPLSQRGETGGFQTPKQINTLKVLDPACGSGSFLLVAYQYLLDWHLKYYTNQLKTNDKLLKQKQPPIYQTEKGNYLLTTSEKKRILLNNIYGVDIDPQAVEVTKLSLLLKVLEDENQQTINNELKFFRERALPDLSNNIKCGNSLIGPDFYDQMEMNFLDDEEKLRINVFDWHKEFPNVFPTPLLNKERGRGEVENPSLGFDVVIGNPPYRMLQPNNTTLEELNYYQHNYNVATFKIDFYHLFIERSLSIVNEQGRLGFIVPSPLLNNVYANNLRNYILNNSKINSLSLPKEKVFKNADVFTVVLCLEKSTNIKEKIENEVLLTTELEEYRLNDNIQFSKIKQNELNSLAGQVWNLLLNDSNLSLIKKIETKSNKLENISKVNRGLITGDREKFFSSKKEDEKYQPILSGSDVLRYGYNEPSEYVKFVKPKSSGGCWDPEMHLADHKILIRQIGKNPIATIIEKPYAITGNIFSIISDSLEKELFILGIINSKLIHFYWSIMFTDFKSSFPQVTIFSLNQLPIIGDSFIDKETTSIFIEKVKNILSLNLKLSQFKTPTERTAIERQIQATDKQIDQLVYQLYGLTEEEIKIVEGETK